MASQLAISKHFDHEAAIRPRSRPASAAPKIIQDFEGHGAVVPQPLDRGFVAMASRPPSRPPSRPQSASAIGAPPAAEPEPRRRRKNAKAFLVHAHVRDKILSINVGEGNQVIYWLGVTAVQRYVRMPDSYSSHFSQELTAKAVISEEGDPLDNNARVAE